MNVLVGPIHFRHVHQTFYTGLDLGKTAVVGQVGHGCGYSRTFWVTTDNIYPWVFAQLLHTQADAVLFAVELKYAHVDFVAYVNHFAWMTDTLPRHVGDVQQAVNATKIYKRAVVGQVLNNTLNVLAFLHRRQQCIALVAVFFFKYRATGNHNVVALLIELNDLEF